MIHQLAYLWLISNLSYAWGFEQPATMLFPAKFERLSALNGLSVGVLPARAVCTPF